VSQEDDKSIFEDSFSPDNQSDYRKSEEKEPKIDIKEKKATR
jgi:hypothetical protein